MKSTKNLGLDNGFPGRDPNLASPEYKSEDFPIKSTCSVETGASNSVTAVPELQRVLLNKNI
jgi:hypothetical protein